MKRLRGKLSYANVVSTLSLFLLIAGGSAFAAEQLGKNSVGSKQLKRGAVTGPKIKNGSVTTAKIAKGAVTGAKIDSSSLGTVPSATNATSAANAAALGGVAANRYVRAQSVLQSGETETGVFGAGTSATSGWIIAAINFIPKAAAPLDEAHTVYVDQTIGSAPHCPGLGKADPGYLCAYGEDNEANVLFFYRPDSSGAHGASVDGTTLFMTPLSNTAYVRGVWAYTAP